jgi:hypothetical protein
MICSGFKVRWANSTERMLWADQTMQKQSVRPLNFDHPFDHQTDHQESKSQRISVDLNSTYVLFSRTKRTLADPCGASSWDS